MTASIGMRTTAVNFVVCANAAKRTKHARLIALNFRQTRQKKYRATKMKNDDPTSVVTSPLCAMKFGSKQKRISEIAAPSRPHTEYDQIKMARPSPTPTSNITSRPRRNIVSGSLRKSGRAQVTSVGALSAPDPVRRAGMGRR